MKKNAEQSEARKYEKVIFVWSKSRPKNIGKNDKLGP